MDGLIRSFLAGEWVDVPPRAYICIARIPNHTLLQTKLERVPLHLCRW